MAETATKVWTPDKDIEILTGLLGKLMVQKRSIDLWFENGVRFSLLSVPQGYSPRSVSEKERQLLRPFVQFHSPISVGLSEYNYSIRAPEIGGGSRNSEGTVKDRAAIILGVYKDKNWSIETNEPNPDLAASSGFGRRPFLWLPVQIPSIGESYSEARFYVEG